MRQNIVKLWDDSKYNIYIQKEHEKDNKEVKGRRNTDRTMTENFPKLRSDPTT